MSLILLRKLSSQKGHIYLSQAVEIEGVVVLKCAGLIDAEVGPFMKGVNPPEPPLFAIVRGLTPQGWAELKRLDGQNSAPTSYWDQMLSSIKRNLPHFKFRNGSDSTLL